MTRRKRDTRIGGRASEQPAEQASNTCSGPLVLLACLSPPHDVLSSLMSLALSVLLVSLQFELATDVPVIHYYPPASTNVNNLTHALNGSGAPGIYNSSQTPDQQYGQYNWCNMPHVRSREYKWVCFKSPIHSSRTHFEPRNTPGNYSLEYVEVIQRHHKRTPYGSNIFFKEDVAWNCDGSGPLNGLKT